MTVYYNDNDPFCARWLRNLIAAGHLPDGEVDERGIEAVTECDLRPFRQCHFFAGIGGFAYAAKLAGWPAEKELWTGGFPCQPFSVAGKQAAQNDDRHLWPHLARLIAQRRPAAFLGENVAGIVPLALDGVLFDLESAGYASRAFVIPACAVDAPHRRDRCWIVAKSLANTVCAGSFPAAHAGVHRLEEGIGTRDVEFERCSVDGDVGDTKSESERKQDNESNPFTKREKARRVSRSAGGGIMDDTHSKSSFWFAESRSESGSRRIKPGVRLLADGIPARVAKLRALGNAIVPQVAAEILIGMRAA